MKHWLSHIQKHKFKLSQAVSIAWVFVVTKFVQHKVKIFVSALLAVFLGFAVEFATQDLSNVHTGSTRAHGDGLYYYVYYRSLVFDRDFDFKNDYKLLGNQYRLKKTKTGKTGNLFTIGPALYWIPFTPIAFAADAIEQAVVGKSRPINGSSSIFQRTVQFGTLFWGFAALFLIVKMIVRRTNLTIGVAVFLGLCFATPLPWYLLRQASYSHGICAFSVTAFVYYFQKTLFNRTMGQWAILGVLFGMTLLVRPQNIGHGILPFVEWLWLSAACFRAGDWSNTVKCIMTGVLFALISILTFFPQMLAWYSIYGDFLTIPQENSGKVFMFWANSRWDATLFSGRHGLFAWHPLIHLSIVGLIVGVFRYQKVFKSRMVPIVMLLAFAFQAYVNGAAWDWWGGWAFGGRRFLSCLVYFGLGLGLILPMVARGINWLGERLTPIAPVIIILLYAYFNIHLMDDYRHSRAKHAAIQDMYPNWKRTVDESFSDLYRKIGNIGAWPANMAYALQTGESPAKYDKISGVQLFFKKKTQVIHWYKSPLPISGWGPAIKLGNKQGRALVNENAVLVLPIREPAKLACNLSVFSDQGGETLTIGSQGVSVLNRTLKKGWQQWKFHLPLSLVHQGFNYLEFAVEKGDGMNNHGSKNETNKSRVVVQSLMLRK